MPKSFPIRWSEGNPWWSTSRRLRRPWCRLGFRRPTGLRRCGGEPHFRRRTAHGPWFRCPRRDAGDQSLLVIAEDGLGATSQQRIYTPAPNGVGDAVFGPHHVSPDIRLPIEVNILNDRPNFINCARPPLRRTRRIQPRTPLRSTIRTVLNGFKSTSGVHAHWRPNVGLHA